MVAQAAPVLWNRNSRRPFGRALVRRRSLARSLAGLCACGLLAPAVAIAKEISREDRALCEEIRAHLDQNGDGRIDRADAAEAREKWREENKRRELERFDKNHNGAIDPEERQTERQALREGMEKFRERREERLARFDKNHDGAVDAQERKEAREDFLRRFDKNRNGVIDDSESVQVCESVLASQPAHK